MKHLKLESSIPETECPAGRQEYVIMDPYADIEQIREGCELACTKGFAAVCVPQWFVRFACESVQGCNIDVATIVGLPGGTTSMNAKYAEVKEAVRNGANDIGIPVNMELIKSKKITAALNDLNGAMVPAKGKTRITAVIEVADLDDTGLADAINVALECGVDYICLSRVLSSELFTMAEVQKAASLINGKAALKIFGGTKDKDQAAGFVEAGAARIATGRSL